MSLQLEKWSALLFARHPDPISLIDEKGNFIVVNEAFSNSYLITPKDFREKTIHDIFPWDKWSTIFTSKDTVSIHEWIAEDRENEIVAFKFTVIACGSVSSENTYFITITNISEQKQKEREFKNISDTLQMIETNSSDFIVIIDNNGIIKYMSTSYSKIFGRSHTDILNHHAFEYVHPDDISALRDRLNESFAGYIYWQPIEFRYLHADGHWVYTDVRATPKETKDGVISQITIFGRDISYRKKMNDLIQHMAYHDSLTGLPNRLFLHERLEQLIEKNEESNQIGVLFIDLDGFKNVNDTMGHSSGDVVLKDMGNRLNQVLAANGFLSRMGGDEFIILLDHIKRAKEAQNLAEKVLSLLKEPFLIDGVKVYLTASIGISLYPKNGDSVEELIRTSDIALYQAKNDGKNRFSFFAIENS